MIFGSQSSRMILESQSKRALGPSVWRDRDRGRPLAMSGVVEVVLLQAKHVDRVRLNRVQSNYINRFTRD